MTEALQKIPFVEISPHAKETAGFVEVEVAGEKHSHYTTFTDGFAFTVRIDSKILPASAINKKLEEEIQRLKTLENRRIGRKERVTIKEAIELALLPQALVKTNRITCFYSIPNKLLFIPVSNPKLSGRIVGLLCQAAGSIKTETIHIDSQKQGLTNRLENHLYHEEMAFDNFELGNYIQMESSDKQKVTLHRESLTDSRAGIKEAIAAGFTVTNVQLIYKQIKFKLTTDFQIKSISKTADTETELEAKDFFELWQHEAATQTLELSMIVNELCKMLGYQPPEEMQLS